MHVVLKDQKEALALLQSAMNKVWVTHRLQVARLNDLGKRHMDTVTRENQFILAKNLCDVEVIVHIKEHLAAKCKSLAQTSRANKGVLQSVTAKKL